MQQTYHFNAKTNVNIREQIQLNVSLSNDEMAMRYNTSSATISKWRNRGFTQDASSAPRHIEYALSELEQALVISIRTTSWLALDEVHEMVSVSNETITRSAVYRCLLKNKINKAPKEVWQKVNLFKAYGPGFLHVDVTYLPKFNGQSYYLFVAIDRATRLAEFSFLT